MTHIVAVFIGENGSLGYQKGFSYRLTLNSDDAKLIIKRMSDGYGDCEYTNIHTFLENWANIVKLPIK